MFPKRLGQGDVGDFGDQPRAKDYVFLETQLAQIKMEVANMRRYHQFSQGMVTDSDLIKSTFNRKNISINIQPSITISANANGGNNTGAP